MQIHDWKPEDDITSPVNYMRGHDLAGYVPWKDSPNKRGWDRNHYTLSDKKKKNVEICLNCTKEKCTGNCAKLATYKYYPKKEKKK